MDRLFAKANDGTFVFQLAYELARAADIPTIAELLFAHTRQLLAADYGFLLLADATGHVLQGVVAYGVGAEWFRQERVEIGTELVPAALAFQTHQPVILTEKMQNSHLSPRLQQRYAFVKSAWIVPLMNGPKAMGAFIVGYASRREAGREELRLLQLLSDEAALALERKRAEEARQEGESRFRRAFDYAMIGIGLLALDGRWLQANRALCQLLGYPESDLQATVLCTICGPVLSRVAHRLRWSPYRLC